MGWDTLLGSGVATALKKPLTLCNIPNGFQCQLPDVPSINPATDKKGSGNNSRLPRANLSFSTALCQSTQCTCICLCLHSACVFACDFVYVCENLSYAIFTLRLFPMSGVLHCHHPRMLENAFQRNFFFNHSFICW